MSTALPLRRKDYIRYFAALALAAQSPCRYKIGAVLYRGKQVLSSAHNIYRTHTDHTDWKYFVNSIHAEHYTLLRAKTDTRGASIYVARAGGIGGTSKPCAMCQSYIVAAGISYVIYTENHILIKKHITQCIKSIKI